MADGMTPGSVDPMFKKPGIGVNGPAPAAQPNVGVQGPGAVGTMAPHPDSPDTHAPHLPKWAADQVRGGGANPYHFVVNNGQLMKALPNLGQPNGGNDEPAQAPAQPAAAAGNLTPAPANVPSLMPAKTEPTSASSAPIGLKAPAAQMRPGVGRPDPARQAMVDQLRYDTYRGDQSNVPNTGSAIAQYDSAKAHGVSAQAQMNASDPNKQIGMLTEIANNPKLSRLYLAGRGQDPNAIPSEIPSGQPINAGNVGTYVAQPQNKGLADVIKTYGSGDLGPLMQVFQGFEGSGDVNHPNNQAMKEHLRQRYAAHPKQWKEDTYIPPNPDKTGLPGPINRLAGIGHAMGSSLFGEHTSGTGLGWRDNYKERTLLDRLLKQMKFTGPASPQ